MPATMAISDAGLAKVADIMARAGMLNAEAAARYGECVELRYLGAARDLS